MTNSNEGLVERLEASIHRINNHWWNRRQRPTAPDIRAAIDTIADLKRERDAMAAVVAAARKLPRATPLPGASSTVHDFKIAAHAVWGLDAALTELDFMRRLARAAVASLHPQAMKE